MTNIQSHRDRQYSVLFHYKLLLLFQYCSLGDDTAMLGGLHGRLYDARFLVFMKWCNLKSNNVATYRV